MFLASAMITGTLVMTSCASDNELAAPNESEQSEEATQLKNQFNEAMDKLNQEMAGLDFQRLAPALEAIEEDASKQEEGSEQKSFNEMLKQLLAYLTRDFAHTRPYGYVLSLQDIQQTLSLAWQLSGENGIARQNGKWATTDEDTNSFSVSYAKDADSIYTVRLQRSVEEEKMDGTVSKVRQRSLTLDLNGEPILYIVAEKESEKPIFTLLPPTEVNFTGEIIYDKYDIALEMLHDTPHQRDINLTYKNAETGSPIAKLKSQVTDNLSLSTLLSHDMNLSSKYELGIMEDLIVIRGEMKSLNQLIANFAQIAAIRKSGTTLEKCNEITADFNTNVGIEMIICGMNVGKVNLTPKLDPNVEMYKPTMIIDSPLFGDEPMDLFDMLASFGLSIDSIMEKIGL